MKNLFPSLPERPKLRDVFLRFPQTIRPLLDFHDRVLRDEGPLTVGERELIAAFVSSLNACRFCAGSHEVFARAHGIEANLIEAVLTDLESAEIDEKLRPLLRYVGKLTVEPSKMVEADAKAVFAAGWSEDALFSAILVCGTFNLMNRMVEGTGCVLDERSMEFAEGDKLPRMERYLAIAEELGLE